MIRFGFAKEDITPRRGIPLCGYFEPRPNCGVLDPLQLRAAVFECNGSVTGIVSYDLCEIDRKVIQRFQAAVTAAGLDFADRLLFCATHTHTGPYTAPLFDGPMDEQYIQMLVDKTVCAVSDAYGSLADAELLTTCTSCSNLAFNRRFWMKDGTVLTNPGKLNPDIVKPEGGIEPEIPILAVKQQGRLQLIVASISNHTDTIGGNLVSADWPGRMEREIQNAVGYDLPVIMLLAAQGNINHFNVNNGVNQTNYGEACRIGKGYAAAIVSQLYALQPIVVNEIRVDSQELEVPYYKVTDEEYAEAKAIVESLESRKNAGMDDLTSEGIAKGNASVKLFFAKALMENRENPITEKRFEQMISLKFGDALGIVSIPAEPFIEIQQAIKSASPFKMTMVAALGMGAFGYIGMPEVYSRLGGYETKPFRTSPAHDVAPKIIAVANDLLRR